MGILLFGLFGIDVPFSKKEEVVVKRVIDGDTIVVGFADGRNERVRLIGIDTPEKNECYFNESKRYLENILFGKKVTLVKDVTDRDTYERLLRSVFLENMHVEYYIAKMGYGKAYPFIPNTYFAREIKEAELYAQREGLGLWSACLNKIL